MAKRFRVPEVFQFRPMTWDELDQRIAAMFPAKPFKQVVHDAKYWMTLPRLGRRGQVVRDAEAAYAIGKVAARVGGGRRPTEEARRADVVPPLCNTGGKLSDEAVRMTSGRQDLETIILQLDEGIVKEVVVRAHGWGDDLAHVDQVTFTCHETTCHIIAGMRLVSELEHVMAMSAKLEEIFGFGVSHQRPKGMHFYKQSWVLGQEDVCYGNLHYGGQRNSICVQITGAGAMAAHQGWEKRLHDFLTEQAVNPRLTRVDLAFDDFVGDYTVDAADRDYEAGLFNCGGRHPYVEHRGDWKRPDGSGRTFYLGKRTNGKFCRIYEKGKEQGCKTSDWVRVEVEFKNVDRVLPFDILLRAGSYLAGAYPAFARFEGLKTPERIDCLMKEQEYAIDHYIHYGAIQVGRLINYMKDIAGWSVDQIVQQLARPDAGYPQRLKLANLSCDLGNQDFIHKFDPAACDADEFANMPEFSFV